jgi:hypothetical protein
MGRIAHGNPTTPPRKGQEILQGIATEQVSRTRYGVFCIARIATIRSYRSSQQKG